MLCLKPSIRSWRLPPSEFQSELSSRGKRPFKVWELPCKTFVGGFWCTPLWGYYQQLGFNDFRKLPPSVRRVCRTPLRLCAASVCRRPPVRPSVCVQQILQKWGQGGPPCPSDTILTESKCISKQSNRKRYEKTQKSKNATFEQIKPTVPGFV